MVGNHLVGAKKNQKKNPNIFCLLNYIVFDIFQLITTAQFNFKKYTRKSGYVEAKH